MADKLVINEECGVFRICWLLEEEGDWLLEEEGDFGATLGDDPKDGPEPTDRNDWEAWKAQKVAREQNPRRDGQGFFWESKGEAQAVLRIVKEALKQERPMPEWAQQALAAGWKPPKGWKA